MAVNRAFQIIVFGATGFTGRYVVAEIKRMTSEYPQLKWAAAGRSSTKLKEALEEVEKCHADVGDLSNITKIVADVGNYESLTDMTARASVVINCVGPYALYGEQVVKACIETGTSHIDISGEQQFLDKIQLNYDEKAREAGVFIVGSCGFDSAPSDLGVLYTTQQFHGDLHSIEGYVKYMSSVEGTAGNFGTLATAINAIKEHSKHRNQYKLLFPKPLPSYKHPLTKRKSMFYCDDIQSWCYLFPGCDASVVRRSQYRFYTEENQRPVQYKVYVSNNSWFRCLFMVLGYMFLFLMASTRCTRELLRTFPRFFTAGAFSKEGPTREKVDNTSFTTTFVGDGYSTKITDPEMSHLNPPDSRIVTRITAPEMGYVTTPICAVQAALLILQERDKLPESGGVFTPCWAFHKTSIFERLEKRGIHFAVTEAQHPKIIG